MDEIMFKDRSEAGRLLAAKLEKYKYTNAVILAVPRGGVPVACEVARELKLPLDLVFVKKLGHPLNKEFAIGAVGLFDSVIDTRLDVSPAYLQQEILAVRQRMKQMRIKFMGSKQPVDVLKKTVIVVDDGIATGNTLLATVKMLEKQQPAAIVIAAPVASRSSVERLEAVARDVVTVLVPPHFGSVGVFYGNFSQVTDEEVVAALRALEGLPDRAAL